MQIAFSAAFDRVNRQGILYELCSVGIGGYIDTVSIKSITASYGELLFRSAARMPQGSILGRLLFLLYVSKVFSILEKKLIAMPMTPLRYLLCHPQALELRKLSP